MDASTTRTADVNAAMFCDFADAGFLAAALVPYVHGQGPALVSDDAKLLPAIPGDRRLPIDDLFLDRVPTDPEDVLAALRLWLAAIKGLSAVVVDMSWGLSTVHGASSYELWGSVADRLAAEIGVPVLSFYNTDQMIEDQLQAAFRAHRQFLAPSGLYENPFWIPAELRQDTALDR